MKLPLLYGIYGGDDPNFYFKIERSFLGGVLMFQLREKDLERDKIIEKALKVKKICKAYNVLFIINDDPELAIEVNADGVHIGKDDYDIKKAREIMKDKILGVSCYDSIERALMAEEQGADYVSFSSPFPSPTKKDKKLVSFDVLLEAKEKLRIPFYVIGGITSENVDLILEKLICGICAISGLYKVFDPFLPAYEIKEKILLRNEGSVTFKD